jgi:hypothetical protein
MTTVIAALAGANTINQMMYNVNQIRSGITFSSNSGIRLPLGTTAQRPTGAAGAFRYNTQLSQFEGYTADGWGSIGGGGLGVFKLVAGTYTANSGDRLAVSTTAATRTVTLPSSPAADAIVEFMDKDASFATNNLLISRNGSTIEGSSANLVADVAGSNFFVQYTGSTWEVFGVGSGLTTMGGDLSGAPGAAVLSAAGLAKIALANTNAYIASMSTDVQLANTNAYIAAVATREAAHTANTLSHLANTNTYTVRTTGTEQTMYPSLVVANTVVFQQGMPLRITGGNTVTLALTDNGKLLMCTNTASAMNIRIPNNSSVAFPVGAEISLVNVLTHATANTLGFVNTAGVILQSKEAANSVADRFTSATLKKTATNTWLLIGNIA